MTANVVASRRTAVLAVAGTLAALVACGDATADFPADAAATATASAPATATATAGVLGRTASPKLLDAAAPEAVASGERLDRPRAPVGGASAGR